MIALLVFTIITAATMLTGAIVVAALNSRIKAHLIHREIARHQFIGDR
jgi:HAMP domain-containing protein